MKGFKTLEQSTALFSKKINLERWLSSLVTFICSQFCVIYSLTVEMMSLKDNTYYVDFGFQNEKSLF